MPSPRRAARAGNKGCAGEGRPRRRSWARGSALGMVRFPGDPVTWPLPPVRHDKGGGGLSRTKVVTEVLGNIVDPRQGAVPGGGRSPARSAPEPPAARSVRGQRNRGPAADRAPARAPGRTDAVGRQRRVVGRVRADLRSGPEEGAPGRTDGRPQKARARPPQDVRPSFRSARAPREVGRRGRRAASDRLGRSRRAPCPRAQRTAWDTRRRPSRVGERASERDREREAPRSLGCLDPRPLPPRQPRIDPARGRPRLTETTVDRSARWTARPARGE